MKCFSLFSGIGGFDLALTRQGHTMVGACEIDKYARSVYAKHFPDVSILDDAREINPEELPDFDILVAGFPCQSFSVAGKRRGFEDTRGTLFFEIARIARKKQPQYMLLENVKGLLSHERGKTVRKIYQTLDELGYDTESRIINTKDFLPQNRERIFIIATLRGKDRREIFPICESIQQSYKGNPKEQIANSLQCPGHSGGNYRGMNMIALTSYDTPQHYRVYDDSGISPSLSASSDDDNYKNILVAIPQMIRNKGMNGRRQKNHNDPVFTIDTTSSAGIFDGKRIRRLTPLECERLQGFEDGYTEGISDSQRYKCLGNAVTVPVVEHIISHLTVQTKCFTEENHE